MSTRLTESYYESMGRGKGVPYMDPTLNYEDVEPDLTKAVNNNIDEQIKDSQQFFRDNIELFNKSLAARDKRWSDLASITKEGATLVSAYKDFKENRGELDRLRKLGLDKNWVNKWVTDQNTFSELDAGVYKDIKVELGVAENAINNVGEYHIRNEKNEITDEATLFIDKNRKIKFIKGENTNGKITFRNDIKLTKTFFGIGFDVHRLVENKKLYLGGAKIPFHSGLKGHSDGDVILHSIIDAILGAMRNKDIGSFFPNTKKYKNIRSPKILKPVVESLYKSNFFINNLDINLICERPKVSKYRNQIISSISKLMMLKKDLINLKGKTVEKLGLIGKEKAIACEVIISITKYD